MLPEVLVHEWSGHWDGRWSSGLSLSDGANSTNTIALAALVTLRRLQLLVSHTAFFLVICIRQQRALLSNRLRLALLGFNTEANTCAHSLEV